MLCVHDLAVPLLGLLHWLSPIAVLCFTFVLCQFWLRALQWGLRLGKRPCVPPPYFQACWVPKPANNCEGMLPFQRRWAFNPTSGLCEDFLYCTGNSSNNFVSFNACRDQCMLGACCLRKARQGLPTGHQNNTQHGYNISSVNKTFCKYDQDNLEDEVWYGNIDFNRTELEDLKGNLQNVDCSEDPDFTYTCDYLTLIHCQALVKDKAGEAQIMCFSPGVRCSDVRCGGGCGCFFHQKLWRYGEWFRQGCEKCTCTCSGRVDCVCRHLTQRKEIRDLTLRERRLYQRAIRKVYARPGKAANLNVLVPFLF